MTVILGEGLEEIGEAAFGECTSLREISIPHAVKAIKDRAFCQCSQLSVVILGEGLEEIGEDAFHECTSLHEIVIPQAVRDIKDSAFHGCSSLTRMVFCDTIERFLYPERQCEAGGIVAFIQSP
jgi:hypothetical protein